MQQAVIFDMDGVLTDSEPVINAAAIAGLKEIGIDAKPEDFLPFVGAGEDRYIGGVANLYGKPYVTEMKDRVYEIYLEMLPSMITAFPGVHELLAQLRANAVPLAVASSADRIKVVANLEAIGVDLAWFGVVVTGEDVVHKKPAPDIYLHTARELGVTAGRCTVVEDALHGVEAAKAAGMRCVAVAHSFTCEQLSEVKSDVVRAVIADISLADLDLAG